MPVLNLKSVKDTSLWLRLNSPDWAGDEVAKTLAANLIGICDDELSARMKAIPTLMPEYTLHDEVHGLRVSELMWRIMPEQVRRSLNPVEVALMILSAFAHDQGMVMEPAELASLSVDGEFRLFRENWEIEHPNVRGVRQSLNDQTLPKDRRETARAVEHELHGAMLSDFIRRTHGERSADYIRTRYGNDPRLRVEETGLAEFVARLAISHVQAAENLVPAKGYRHDERIGMYGVNMAYVGAILRLADIMDFDRDRTPDSLYRTINFRSDVSLREWQKHRSVDGWAITSDVVQYTLRCEHPEYQRAAYQFMDWIDQELAATRNLVASFPATAERYSLELPLRVDRSRIEPKDHAYLYRDLEFSLSRDEIVSLLMTEKLYGGAHLCVRELLQNALDALRHRQAVMRRDGVEWTKGRVEFTHELDPDGFELLRCTDNGIGMTEDVIDRFLTKAGRSYYRSPEFEIERASFRHAGADFDPAAQFGIGFMSCFMVGDDIRIHTRRDFGPSAGHGKPLIIEINGLGGMVVIRDGDPQQTVGTTVEIRSRTRSSILDDWDDRINLLLMLEGYALAAEFPVSGTCSIPEISGRVDILPGFSSPATQLETKGYEGIRTFEVRFDRVSNDLDGVLRASFIVDAHGRLVLEDGTRRWLRVKDYAAHRAWRLIDGKEEIDGGLARQQVCVDGVLVAGELGRNGSEAAYRLGHYSSPVGLGRAAYIIDARRSLKPALTPARAPVDGRGRGDDPTWTRLERVARRAWGMLWEEIAQLVPSGLTSETFWRLAEIYAGGIMEMRASRLWSHVHVPVIGQDGSSRTVSFHELGPLRIRVVDGQVAITSSHGEIRLEDGSSIPPTLNSALLASCRVVLEGEHVLFEPSDIARTESRLGDSRIRRHFARSVYALSYAAPLETVLTVASPVASVNRNHPLIVAMFDAANEECRLHQFVLSLLALVVDDENRSWLTGVEPVDSFHRRIGMRFLDVEPELATSAAPPYVIQTGEQRVNITRSDLLNWFRGRR